MLEKLLVGVMLLALPRRPRRKTAVAHVAIDTSKPGAAIDRHIYGQFAEHLGRGIYEGIWVAKAARFPNIRGYRKDVVDALKENPCSECPLPGGCFGDLYDWRDGIGPQGQAPRAGECALGRA
jgi:alpha-N-arabinofuranosidase